MKIRAKAPKDPLADTRLRCERLTLEASDILDEQMLAMLYQVLGGLNVKDPDDCWAKLFRHCRRAMKNKKGFDAI